MIFSLGDWGLPIKERTSFNLEKVPKRAHENSGLNLRKFQTCVLAQVLLTHNLPRHFWAFFPCPLAWLEAQRLSQVRNCQCSQINHGPGYLWIAAGSSTALPGRLGVTKGSAAAAGATVSPSLDSTGRECFATNLSFWGPSIAEPKWASWKFKLMSGPVMSWQEPWALRDPRRTSDTTWRYCAQQVSYSVGIYLVPNSDISMECTLVA